MRLWINADTADEYIKAHGSAEAAKEAMKEAVQEAAPGGDDAE